jgi:transposase-like protein
LPQEAPHRRRRPVGAGGDKDIMNKANENPAGRGERRQFDETYKRHAVELTLQSGRTVRAVAQELGVTNSMLYEWRRIYAPRPSASG